MPSGILGTKKFTRENGDTLEYQCTYYWRNLALIWPRSWPLYLAAIFLVIDVVWLYAATKDVHPNPIGSQAYRLFFLVILLTAGVELSKWKKLEPSNHRS